MGWAIPAEVDVEAPEAGETARYIAQMTGELTALGIVEVPEGMPLSEGATRARQARRLLQKVLDYAPEGTVIHPLVRIGRHAAAGIVEAAAEQEALQAQIELTFQGVPLAMAIETMRLENRSHVPFERQRCRRLGRRWRRRGQSAQAVPPEATGDPKTPGDDPRQPHRKSGAKGNLTPAGHVEFVTQH